MHKYSYHAIGTTCAFITLSESNAQAEEVFRDYLAELDEHASRFRTDSEVTTLSSKTGWQPVSEFLFPYLEAALRAANLTQGAVDPTLGKVLVALGYDKDFESLKDEGRLVVTAHGAWQDVKLDREEKRVCLPQSTLLDLGATAKAMAADILASRLAEITGGGVLVSLGGDIAVSGSPQGGWKIGIARSHTGQGYKETIALTSGGLATSSTELRVWSRDGKRYHHLIDPHTGTSAKGAELVSVHAASCLDANIASTAAIVKGDKGAAWLASTGLMARTEADGKAMRYNGWPGAVRC